jgi:regulator of sirC expression with transglutaminase-like and TPR domain
MNQSVSQEAGATLTEAQKAALLNLLTDEDTSVYQAIRAKILSLGEGSRSWLAPHRLSSDAVLRRRAKEIIDHLDRQTADNHFLAFCLNQGHDVDMEEGAWLLAKTQYPSINVEAYRALLDTYASELRERLGTTVDAEPVIAVINEFLFKELGFAGNEENYYDPDNSYLNSVLDRRTGIPISLCAVFLLLARRLNLPVVGVAMPGHFLCRYQTSRDEIFIDVFNKGRLLTKTDCMRYLLQTGHEFSEGLLAPAGSRGVLRRMCSNLEHIYASLGLAEEVSRLKRYTLALAK